MRDGHPPNTSATGTTVAAPDRHRWSALCIVMVLLAVTLLVAPAILSSPKHIHAFPTVAPPPRAAANACLENPEPDTMLCVYAAVAQAAVRHPVTPFFLLAFVVLASMVYRLRRVPVYRGECWWPRDRLRAFLQVFLI